MLSYEKARRYPDPRYYPGDHCSPDGPPGRQPQTHDTGSLRNWKGFCFSDPSNHHRDERGAKIVPPQPSGIRIYL